MFGRWCFNRSPLLTYTHQTRFLSGFPLPYGHSQWRWASRSNTNEWPLGPQHIRGLSTVGPSCKPQARGACPTRACRGRTTGGTAPSCQGIYILKSNWTSWRASKIDLWVWVHPWHQGCKSFREIPSCDPDQLSVARMLGTCSAPSPSLTPGAVGAEKALTGQRPRPRSGPCKCPARSHCAQVKAAPHTYHPPPSTTEPGPSSNVMAPRQHLWKQTSPRGLEESV